jgi:excisionase family DNA binding protein
VKRARPDDPPIADLQTHSEPHVTVSQLARYWRVSRQQVYKQINAGLLRACRMGPRVLRISTADAVDFEHLANSGQTAKAVAQSVEQLRGDN